jgi:CRP-like cAMP-binding protein
VERVDAQVVNSTLKSGDYFGDEVLVDDDHHYRATVVALQTTACWKLDKATLKRTVASLGRSYEFGNMA